jgi:Holliday junction resolvase RusA-like endonuclease
MIEVQDSNPFETKEAPKVVLGEKQVILGDIPSKSNGYKIILVGTKDKQHGSLAKTKVLKDYEHSFFIQCNKYRNANIDTYFTLEVEVYYSSQRPDLDGCFKILLDCLQKVGAVKNDNKCTRIVADKYLDKANPRIEFMVTLSMKK